MPVTDLTRRYKVVNFRARMLDKLAIRMHEGKAERRMETK